MKNTVFSIELELKLLALIVIVLPIPPNAGSIESMIGWGKINDIKNNIDDIYLNTLKSTKYYPTMCGASEDGYFNSGLFKKIVLI